MYKCERCGGTFAQFKTPGQCPLCGVWASVRCSGCGYTAHANEFVKNSDRCPQCGAQVSVPGSSGSLGSSDSNAVIGCIVLSAIGVIACAIYNFFS
jgi:DNA-directed RNA polymerase subunit RPC12/RpoP